ncbi:transcriptional regulator with XRE-family HTH domain [Bartonella callosciuri]|uniref:Transcriptional regulator with XRE-family HTH domain n=1 Tax=Bartonella callosciuri TaxID=686223 RepID=A0A840NX34_9HYPH|nr:helix-turn-helix transcriptional regulator [Bartonella callosciuri]MBB5074505.1 transcriptional regulator with XRE-family HTH domain [Bartonella callosciuri]
MSSNIEKSIQQWLEKKLEERGHGAQVELAAYLGIHQSTISRMINPYKNGKSRSISIGELVKMAKFFNDPPPNFFTDVDQEFMNFYRDLSEENKRSVVSYIEFLRQSKDK